MIQTFRALSKSAGAMVALRSGFDAQITVDHATGVIGNVAVLTAGPACGIGFEGQISPGMLEDVCNSINAQGGVKVRMTHVELQGSPLAPKPDDIAFRVGRVKNCRIVGNQVRGDLHIGKYAANSPAGNGDMRAYLLDLAEEDPSAFGLSIMWPSGAEGDPINVTSVDIVGTPAANPGGLLSSGVPNAQTSFEEFIMNPKLKAYLEACGLKAGASDTDAVAFYRGLKGAKKTKAVALAEGDVVDPEEEPAAGVAEGDVTPDITPEAKEAEQDFLQRFVNDAAMQAKYADGAARAAKAKEIFGAYTAKPVQDPPVEPPSGDIPMLSAQKVAQQALASDATRRKAIMALARESGVDEAYAQGLCDRGVTQAMAVELIGLSVNRAPLHTGATAFGGKDRKFSGLADGLRDGILLRSGVAVANPASRANEFRGLSLIDMYRHYLSALGVSDAFNLSRVKVADLLSKAQLRRLHPDAYALAMSTSDFDNITLDAINKSLLKAYEDAKTTWNLWARRVTAPDFKYINRVALSEYPDLESRNEGGELNYVTLTDSKERYLLVEYASGIRLTRKAIINDDLDAFNRIPTLQGMAAARKEDDVAYAIITANAALSDGTALFHDDHNNVVDSGSGKAPSVASLATTEQLLMKQKGPKSAARLDLRARYMLVPSTLYRSTQQLISSPVDPALTNDTPNPFAGEGIVVIPSARLDDTSPSMWYLLADFNQVDTVEVAFLEDEQQPVLKQETDFDTDDQKFAVRHTVAAKAIDFRGMARNYGS